MKRITAVSIVSAFAISLLAIPGSVSAAPYCGITWGSGIKASADTSNAQLTNIRTGRHACYDRMVLDLNGPAAGYDVRYVSNIYTEGQGKLVPLKGGAKLQIIVQAPDHNDAFKRTYIATAGKPLPRVSVAGYTTFRDAKYAGSFEGQTSIGLGVRAKLPFRVMKVGNRVVVDVAHKW